MQYGYLRETEELAVKAGIDEVMQLPRTGLDTYLKLIFPNTFDWIHDKILGKINNVVYRVRPDYRSESLKLIVEFDGLPHYTNPDIIKRDFKNKALYEFLGYKVIRIPYFIQLTKDTIKRLFDIDINIEVFPEDKPSLYAVGTPSYLCTLGIMRMAAEFKLFDNKYYRLNLEYMKQYEPNISAWQILDIYYNDNNINIQMFYDTDFIEGKKNIY
jgi:hypothetical protein